MDAVFSHPVTVTNRDLLKEKSVTAWFESFKDHELNIQVRGARRLQGPENGYYCDPYCILRVGNVERRSHRARHTLDPDWNEQFCFSWEQVAKANRRIVLEVWDGNTWAPDELLGAAILDLCQLAMEPDEPLQLALALMGQQHDARRRQKEQQQRRKQLQQQQRRMARKKEREQQWATKQRRRSARQLHPPPPAAAQQQPSSPFAAHASLPPPPPPDPPPQQQPPPQATLAPAGTAVPGVVASAATPPAPPDLGEVRLCCWWSPCAPLQSHAPREVTSLAGRQAGAAPATVHCTCGTLYEEPCVVYIKVMLFDLQLDPGWLRDQLQRQAAQQQAVIRLGPLRLPGLAGLFRRLRGRRRDDGSDAQSDAASVAGSETSAASALLSPADLDDQDWFASVSLKCGSRQQEARPSRLLLQQGLAHVRQSLVFTAQRPLRDKQITVQVSLLCRGRPSITFSEQLSLLDLLRASPPPPSSYLGAMRLRTHDAAASAPVLPLGGLRSGALQLLAHAVDADYRAGMYGVPAVADVTETISSAGSGDKSSAPRKLLRRLTRTMSIGSAAARSEAAGGNALAALVSEPQRNIAPLATLKLLLHSVELEAPRGQESVVLIKCGPHWAQTKGSTEQCCEIGWELHLPVYHPSTSLVVGVFAGGRALGRSQFRIAGLMAAAPGGGSSLRVLKLFSGRSGPGGQRLLAGTVTLMLSCEVPSMWRLWHAYERSPLPPAAGTTGLTRAVARDQLAALYADRVVAWLAAASPCIPTQAAKKMLATGRESFSLATAKAHVQRLKEAAAWLGALRRWKHSLEMWQSPGSNLAVALLAYCCCFHTAVTCLAFIAYRVLLSVRRVVLRISNDYLGAEIFDVSDDEEDSSSWGAPGAADSSGGDSGGGGGGGGGGGVSGGPEQVPPSAAALQPQLPFLKLWRRYERVAGFALQVQNRMDDIATLLERLGAIAAGHDPLASVYFYSRCLALAVLVSLVGPGRVLFVAVLWLIRPPQMRRPPGVTGPVEFVRNMPSRSAADV